MSDGYADITGLKGLLRQTKDLELPGGATVQIRSLLDVEREKVLTVQFEGWSLAMDTVTMTEMVEGGEEPAPGSLTVKVGDVLLGEVRANRLACQYGLLRPQATADDVAVMHPDVVERIGMEVRRISGLDQTASEVAEGLAARGLQ